MNTASQGSRTAARFFLSRAFLDRDLHRCSRVLPTPADYLRALVPLALWPDVWTGIQSRARVDLARLNEAAGRAANRKGGND